MSEMVERVAKAIFADQMPDVYDAAMWDHSGSEATREVYRKHARAAIEAMRIPTKDMQDAYLSYAHMVRASDNTPTVIGGWKTMIDVALK